MSGAIRVPRFAGRLYPADAHAHGELRTRLGAGLGPGRARLALVPHGGLDAAGPVLAQGLAGLARPFEAAALVGPLHEPRPDQGPEPCGDGRLAWDLPGARLALVPAGSLGPGLVRGDDAAHDRDHALEGLAAWLSLEAPPPAVLPLLLPPGAERAAGWERFGEALAAWLHAPGRVLLASADLDHYHGPAPGAALRRCMVEAIASGDPHALERPELVGTAATCGPGPIRLFLELARRLGRPITVVAEGAGGRRTGGTVGYVAALA